MVVLQPELARHPAQRPNKLHAAAGGCAAQLTGDLGPAQALVAEFGQLPFLRA
jgi:hypothetical protein